MAGPSSSSSDSPLPQNVLFVAADPGEFLVPFSLPKDGRSLRTLPNGVNCTPEKRLIAVHYAFHSKTKRPLPESTKSMGLGKTTLYRWKTEYNSWLKAPQSAALKAHVAALHRRSDAENLARFLDLSPSVNNPSPDGTRPTTRADGLGPNAEAHDPDAGLLQPGQLPLEQLDNICRVGGAELPTDEEVEKLGEVDDDLNEEGGALVGETLTNAVTLHRSSQR
ncbi:hypothetical protein A4X06_0g9947, partial [Tilletia controversa]